MAEAFRKSGLTAQEFAERHGIGVWRVRRWSGVGPGSKDGQALIKRSSVVRFAPVRIAEPETRAALEVVVGRTVVRVGREFDAELLRRVVLALGELPC
jgi:hypothetical protein